MNDEQKKTLATTKKADLVERCRQYNISEDGTKEELFARIICYEEDIIEQTEEINEGNNLEIQADIHSSGDGSNKQKQREQKLSEPVLTFRDVEETLSIFTGEENVRDWIREFEEVADMIGWSDLQRVLYAKRLIKGSAKIFLSSKALLRTWQMLKAVLLKEFSIEQNSAHVHEELRNRKKKAEESFKDYMYSMVAIAKRIHLEDVATIEYIIQGIQDDERNKIVLYGANTISELKQRFDTYGRIVDTMKKKKLEQRIPEKRFFPGKYKSVKTTSNADEKQPKKEGNSQIICYNCNEVGHLSRNCPKINEGRKCMECGEFGHLRKNRN